jgi:membrane associated rhomboid family serine protease
MQKLFDDLSEEEVQTYGLVLLSSGIDHKSVKGRNGWELHVDEGSFSKASELLQAYLIENRSFLPSRKKPSREYPKTFSGLWGALVILCMHVAVNSGHDAGSFAKVYGSAASRILIGEWYRCATSLLLHADYVHLVGNLAGIAVFGTAVCSIMGWGIGWALMLAAGILGNLANAFFYQTAHLSIGASTAVFGAVGLLSAYQFIDKIRLRGEWYKAFLPIAAGMALLAFMGASRQTDIMGHLFGFLAGLVLGMTYRLFVRQPLHIAFQFGAIMIVISALVVAWFWPMMGGIP